jgi:processed acidic surface protein
MKRLLLTFVMITIHLSLNIDNGVFAAVSHDEVKKHVEDLGLSYEKFQDYLAFHELTLDEFETLEELDTFIGTPITEANLNELLATQDLSKEELQSLLSGFGESLDQYLFIEDLEVDVIFYLEHAEVIQEAQRLLADVGLSEDEVDRLFHHILSIDKSILENDIDRITQGLEPFYSYEGTTELTADMHESLMDLYNDMLTAFQLTPSYYVLNAGEKSVISMNDLFGEGSLKGDKLLVELTNAQGSLVLDFEVTEKMLVDDFLLVRGEQLMNVAGLASELSVSMAGDQLPNTASPFWRNLVIAVLIILFGFLLNLRQYKA